MILFLGLFILALISGMLGLGVAFAAVPFLGFFFQNLVHQIQPISLLLNGITAIFAAVGFAMAGYIDWKKAIYLSIITTISAPVGAYLVQNVEATYVWYIYLFAVIFLAYKLFSKTETITESENFKMVCLLAVPISVLCGFFGVGPGF